MDGIVGICVILLVVLGPIWIAIKAKPIREKPYRWGTFVGIQLAAQAFSVSWLNYNLFPEFRVINFAISVGSALASVGILRRQKVGVVMFGITSAVMCALSVFRFWGQPWGILNESVAPSVYAAISIVYFKKRWAFLRGQDASVPPPRSEITHCQSSLPPANKTPAP